MLSKYIRLTIYTFLDGKNLFTKIKNLSCKERLMIKESYMLQHLRHIHLLIKSKLSYSLSDAKMKKVLKSLLDFFD
jgi:hypothetical protein